VEGGYEVADEGCLSEMGGDLIAWGVKNEICREGFKLCVFCSNDRKC
jgi:hypothetical protein